jgi:hypothetical protein
VDPAAQAPAAAGGDVDEDDDEDAPLPSWRLHLRRAAPAAVVAAQGPSEALTAAALDIAAADARGRLHSRFCRLVARRDRLQAEHQPHRDRALAAVEAALGRLPDAAADPAPRAPASTPLLAVARSIPVALLRAVLPASVAPTLPEAMRGPAGAHLGQFQAFLAGLDPDVITALPTPIRAVHATRLRFRSAPPDALLGSEAAEDELDAVDRRGRVYVEGYPAIVDAFTAPSAQARAAVQTRPAAPDSYFALLVEFLRCQHTDLADFAARSGIPGADPRDPLRTFDSAMVAFISAPADPALPQRAREDHLVAAQALLAPELLPVLPPRPPSNAAPAATPSWDEDPVLRGDVVVFPAPPMTALVRMVCLFALLRPAVVACPGSLPWLSPVGAEFPHYADVVAAPVHVSLIARRLIFDQYAAIDGFLEDLDRIFSNSVAFNGAAGGVTASARATVLAVRNLCLYAVVLLSVAHIHTHFGASVERQLSADPAPDAAPSPTELLAEHAMFDAADAHATHSRELMRAALASLPADQRLPAGADVEAMRLGLSGLRGRVWAESYDTEAERARTRATAVNVNAMIALCRAVRGQSGL